MCLLFGAARDVANGEWSQRLSDRSEMEASKWISMLRHRRTRVTKVLGPLLLLLLLVVVALPLDGMGQGIVKLLKEKGQKLMRDKGYKELIKQKVLEQVSPPPSEV